MGRQKIYKRNMTFFDIYREAIETFVSKFRVKEKWRKDWFNKRCESAKNKRRCMEEVIEREWIIYQGMNIEELEMTT